MPPTAVAKVGCCNVIPYSHHTVLGSSRKRALASKNPLDCTEINPFLKHQLFLSVTLDKPTKITTYPNRQYIDIKPMAVLKNPSEVFIVSISLDS